MTIITSKHRRRATPIITSMQVAACMFLRFSANLLIMNCILACPDEPHTCGEQTGWPIQRCADDNQMCTLMHHDMPAEHTLKHECQALPATQMLADLTSCRDTCAECEPGRLRTHIMNHLFLSCHWKPESQEALVWLHADAHSHVVTWTLDTTTAKHFVNKVTEWT
jgi:hypothetical protein